MAKENRPNGTSSQDVQTTTSNKAKIDSSQAGKRSEELGLAFHVNEQGEYCVGDECFQVRIKPGSGEVRVVIDRNECGKDAEPVIDAIVSEISHGGSTVYETKSTKRS